MEGGGRRRREGWFHESWRHNHVWGFTLLQHIQSPCRGRAHGHVFCTGTGRAHVHRSSSASTHSRIRISPSGAVPSLRINPLESKFVQVLVQGRLVFSSIRINPLAPRYFNFYNFPRDEIPDAAAFLQVGSFAAGISICCTRTICCTTTICKEDIMRTGEQRRCRNAPFVSVTL